MRYRYCEISAGEKAMHAIYYLSIISTIACLIISIIMGCLPDKYAYKYEGDIISHTGTVYIDIPEEHRIKKICDIITYKDLDGNIKTYTIKRDFNNGIPKQIKKNNFKYMYSCRIGYLPEPYLIGMIISMILYCIYLVWIDSHHSYTLEELDLFRPLRKFFGK